MLQRSIFSRYEKVNFTYRNIICKALFLNKKNIFFYNTQDMHSVFYKTYSRPIDNLLTFWSEPCLNH